MLDDTSRKTIGGQLRRMYEERPKGGIPDRLWRLLLAIEAVGSGARDSRRVRRTGD